jgi:hypothetical protein
MDRDHSSLIIILLGGILLVLGGILFVLLVGRDMAISVGRDMAIPVMGGAFGSRWWSARRSGLHRRKLDRDDQFAGLKGSLEQSFEEVFCFHLAFACKAAEHKRRAERHSASRQLRRRVGVGEAAAERSAVADRHVSRP